MKRMIIIGLALFSLTAVCRAENATVTLSVWMRTGPGTEHETISTIKTGETVEVIGQGKGWSRVRSQDGRQGWVSARYLTTEGTPDLPPAKIPEGPPDPEALEAETLRLQSVIAEKDLKIDDMQQAYEKLKADASEFISLQNQLEAALAELSETKTSSENLKKTIDDLQNDRILKGALIGAGILLLGILIGLVFKKQRRRSSLLLI